MQHVGISPGRQKCSQVAETSLAISKEAITAAIVAEKNFILTLGRELGVYANLQDRTVVHFIVVRGIRVSPEGRSGGIGYVSLFMFHTMASAEQW